MLQVDWESEQACFETFARECGRFYSFKPDPFAVENETGQMSGTDDDVDTSATDGDMTQSAEGSCDTKSKNSWKWTVEHVLFPVFRSGLVPPKHFADDGTLLQVANLPDLYKVFERC